MFGGRVSAAPDVVTVLFFAAARDAANTAELTLDAVPEGYTVEALSKELAARFPALGVRLGWVRFAVNGEYVRLEHPVRLGDEVALIPPVAGG